RDEFYTRPLPSGIEGLQRELDAYLDYYNGRRPHRALGGLAPLGFLAKLKEEGVPTESQMCWPTTCVSCPPSKDAILAG
ncbi:integrase core domain-containing protein, partial [Thermus sp.]|uniref:integrase core domain-containing protein n=1 Tax=Thermus sp. TaxID=275 RepID=UPI00307FC720